MSFRLSRQSHWLNPATVSSVDLPVLSPTIDSQILVYNADTLRFDYEVYINPATITTLTGQKRATGEVIIGDGGTPISNWFVGAVPITATIPGGGGFEEVVTTANENDVINVTPVSAPPNTLPIVGIREPEANQVTLEITNDNDLIPIVVGQLFQLNLR